jgi:hypothetical protein
MAVKDAEGSWPRVFLSYSRKDRAFAEWLASSLTARGFVADWDQASTDPDNISTGISAEDEWWDRLQQMITAADVVVFVISPDAAASKVCDEEIAYARALGKRTLAILCRPIDFSTAPPRLAALSSRVDGTWVTRVRRELTSLRVDEHRNRSATESPHRTLLP